MHKLEFFSLILVATSHNFVLEHNIQYSSYLFTTFLKLFLYYWILVDNSYA